MRYGTVCSGIEAPSVAWHPLGWKPAFFSEIEPFPSAVLAHHYPHVPNRGDMTRFEEWPDDAIDLLAGGTPCQSFSVAGLRAGLADPRGNLLLTYLAIAAQRRPRWVVWENVPGVLSVDGGRAFGALLGGLAELGYGWAYRVLDAQFCRAHGLEGAVPQRRRRVFVIGCLGDWRGAAAVLFDAASLRGDSPPRREAGKNIAPTISARTKGGGGLGTDFDLDGGLVEAANVSHALRGEGHDASEDGTGRGTPIVPAIVPQAMSSKWAKGSSGPAGDEIANLVAEPIAIPFDTTQMTSAANRSAPKAGDPSHPLAAGAHPPAIAIQAGAFRENPESGPDGVGVRDDGAAYTIEARAEVQAVAIPAIAFTTKDHGADAADEVAPTMRAMGFDGSHANGGGQLGVAMTVFDSKDMTLGSDGAASTLTTNGESGKAGGRLAFASSWAVRRLTPVECARLQGFPDDYLTSVSYRGKPPADGPMYRALGNSMAVNVVRVIGERIQMVDEMMYGRG